MVRALLLCLFLVIAEGICSVSAGSEPLSQPGQNMADICADKPPQRGDVERIRARIARNRSLYENGSPTELSDPEYDGLVSYLEQLERCFSNLAEHSTPAAHSQQQIRHAAPMLSLHKARDERQLADFLQRHALDGVILQPKFDGIAVELVYRNGRLHTAATRGNGDSGRDISRLFKRVHDLPQQIATEQTWVIRGELISEIDCFSRRGADYSSPRQMAAALAMQLEPDDALVPCLRFLPYAVVVPALASERRALVWLRQLGFADVDALTHPVSTLEQLQGLAEQFRQTLALQLPLDGIVVKVDSISIQHTLGMTQRAPNWALAWKFEQPDKVTRVLAIDWRLGRTGRVTPRLQIEPVQINNRSIEYVSAHSQGWLQNNGAGIGALISVHLKGDAIPQIKHVLQPSASLGAPPTGPHPLLCLSDSEPCRVRFPLQLEYSAKIAGIEGIGAAGIRQWQAVHSVATLSDMFREQMMAIYPALKRFELGNSCAMLRLLGIPRSSNKLRETICQAVPDSSQLRRLALNNRLPELGISKSSREKLRAVLSMQEVGQLLTIQR